MLDINNGWKVQLGAELNSDARKDIETQLLNIKGLKVKIEGSDLGKDFSKTIQDSLNRISNLSVQVDAVNFAKDFAQNVQQQLNRISFNLNIDGDQGTRQQRQAREPRIVSGSRLANTIGSRREQAEISRVAKEEKEIVKQSKAINKALDDEYKLRQKNTKQTEKQLQKDRERAVQFTKQQSERLSSAISKYSYGDSSEASNLMKKMNRGLSNFGDLSNISGDIDRFESEVDGVISKLAHSHEVALASLNQEIKAEQTLQSQKDSFHNKNINAIDLEIERREEESRHFSSILKEQMELGSKVNDIQFDIDTEKFSTEIGILKNQIGKFGIESGAAFAPAQKSVFELTAAYANLKNVMDDPAASNYDKIKAEEEYQKCLVKTKNLLKELKSDKDNELITVGDNRRINMINKLNAYLQKNTAMTEQSKQSIRQWIETLQSSDDLTVGSLKNINNEFKRLDTQVRNSGKLGLSTFDKLKQAWEKFGGWSIATGALTSVAQFIRHMPQEVIAVDTAMTNLYKVTDETDTKYNSFLQSANKNAQKLGRTISGLITQTSEWAKLGYSLDDSEKLAQVSSIYANVGEVDDATAVSDMVTAMKAFNIEAENAIEIVNMYNKLGNEFATSAKDLGSGLTRSASSMATAGTSINKTLALLTGGSEITQNATEFGNFLKVSSMRIRGMTGELEALGEEVDSTVDSISKVQTQILNRTGGKVNIFDDMGNFRDYYDIMQDISEVYNELSSTDKASLTEILFGKMRGNQGAALIQAFQSGQIQKALQATYDAAGSAEEEQDKWLQSEEAKIEQLKASYQSLAQTIFDSDFLKGGTDLLRVAVNLLDEIIDKTGIIVPLLGGLSGFGTFKSLD